MKKYFIFSDVHSCYDALMNSLIEAGFEKDNPNHIVISLGDLLDRGSQTMECLKFINSLPDDRKILIEGNHEDLLKSALRRKSIMYYDESNGTSRTIAQIAEDTCSYHDEIFKDDWFLDCENNPELKKYLNSLVFYHETPNHVFVHGWIPIVWTGEGSWRDSSDHRKSWFTPNFGGAWLNGMKEWRQGHRDSEGKTIICGHFHTSWGHKNIHSEAIPDIFDLYYDNKLNKKSKKYKNLMNTVTRPFIDEGIVALDASTIVSNRVNVYVIDEDNI